MVSRLKQFFKDIVVAQTSTSGGVAGGVGAGTRRARKRRKGARDESDSSTPPANR